jgi:hypothetical protein
MSLTGCVCLCFEQQEMDVRLANQGAQIEKLKGERDVAKDDCEHYKGKYEEILSQHSVCPDRISELEDAKALAIASEKRIAGTVESVQSSKVAQQLKVLR